MDPSPPAAQPAATLKRVASSLGFYQDSTPPKTQTQEDNSMQEGWSPGTDYTRRYSFLPEDSIASVHDAEASFSSADSRPAIRSIPSRLSLALDGAASADMLLDEVPDPAKASSIFASASNTDTVSRDHPPPPEFGNESLVASQFDFKSPETAPSMPVGPSFAGLFHAFMGNSKDKKPDRFAAAHEAQFSR